MGSAIYQPGWPADSTRGDRARGGIELEYIAAPLLVNIVDRERNLTVSCVNCSTNLNNGCDLAPFDHIGVGPFDRDQYDDKYAEYLVVNDPLTGRHRGSLRLLRTDRPHVLESVFPDLCAFEVPSGPSIREITQICLSPNLRARERQHVSHQLATVLTEYGLLMGITAYTTVMELIWAPHVLGMGLTCEPLGLARYVGDALLGAFQLQIDGNTISGLREAGCYTPCELNVKEAPDCSSIDTLLQPCTGVAQGMAGDMD